MSTQSSSLTGMIGPIIEFMLVMVMMRMMMGMFTKNPKPGLETIGNKGGQYIETAGRKGNEYLNKGIAFVGKGIKKVTKYI
jgi:hypothetical protein